MSSELVFQILIGTLYMIVTLTHMLKELQVSLLITQASLSLVRQLSLIHKNHPG